METKAKPLHKEQRRIALEATLRGAVPVTVDEWVSWRHIPASCIALLCSQKQASMSVRTTDEATLSTLEALLNDSLGVSNLISGWKVRKCLFWTCYFVIL
jgi:hypothetical protein